MERVKKKLLVIHTPPPFGGGEIQAQNIKTFFSEKSDYIIYDYSRKSHNRSNWGRIDMSAIIHGLIWIIKVSFLIIRHNPEKLYFTLPKSYLGFMRNMTVLPLAHLFKVRIFGELPGTSFLFLENAKTFKYKTGLFFLKRIDEIRFLSPSIARMHDKYKLRCPVVIYNGIDIPPRTAVSVEVFNKEYFPLVYIGAIESLKGVFNILEAVKLCKGQNIKTNFHFIGYWVYDSEKDRALRFIKENCLDDLFTFHGIKTGKEKWDILSECAVLVHPSYWDGVPLTILEAMSLGMSIISTSIGGIPDTVKHNVNGLILQENTPAKLAEAIIQLNKNRSMLNEFSKANKALFNEKYRLEIFLKNMEFWFNS
jgi:glycosyltransferase involved in cell wall biosynthesis